MLFFRNTPPKPLRNVRIPKVGVPPLETEADMMTAENRTPSIPFIVTMDIAYKQLERGVLSPEEYQSFLKKMTDKYQDEDTRILYQSKLAIYRDKSDI